MRRLFLIACVSVLIFSMGLAAAEDRHAILLDTVKGLTLPTPGGTGKLAYGTAIARLHDDAEDAAARQFIATSGMGGGDYPFNAQMQIRGYLQFRDSFNAAESAAIEAAASGVAEWNQDYTENHSVLLWSSAYLYGQAFPSATWRWSGQTISSSQIQQRAKQAILSYGKSVWDRGYSDFLSPIYDFYKFAAWLNLYDFADDAEVRTAAAAMLFYHYATLWLAASDELIVAPMTRAGGNVQGAALTQESQWLLWLYSNAGDVSATGRVSGNLPYVIMAISDWRPPEFMRHPLADVLGESSLVYKTQAPHFFMGEPGYMLRTTYHERDFTLSSGIQRIVTENWQRNGFRQVVNDDLFGLVWRGTGDPRTISVTHPYWTSSGGENSWSSRSSPFVRIGQHQNTAIVLFDIPASDPFAGLTVWGDARAAEMIPLAQLRFPATGVTFQNFGDDWLGLQSGEVLVAIHVLQSGLARDRRILASEGFEVIKSRGEIGQRWQTGFVIEVSSLREFASLDAFIAAAKSGMGEVLLEPFVVSYTGTRGDTLSVEFVGSEDPTMPQDPVIRVNTVELDLDTWPHLESPFSTLADSRLQFLAGEERVRIDWRDTVPVFVQRRDFWRGWPIVDGWADTGDFLGPVFPMGDFVYLWNWQRFVYMPSTAEFGGDWMYIFTDESDN